MFIWNADGASMKLNEINYFRAKDDLIYHKIYNLIKDLFAFIIKKHLPFNNLYFEELFYFQSELLRWHRINRDEDFAFSMPNMKTTFIIDFSSFKDRQIKAYVRIKQRISDVIRVARAQSQDFELRKEYRQTLEFYRRQKLFDSLIEIDL